MIQFLQWEVDKYLKLLDEHTFGRVKREKSSKVDLMFRETKYFISFSGWKNFDLLARKTNVRDKGI